MSNSVHNVKTRAVFMTAAALVMAGAGCTAPPVAVPGAGTPPSDVPARELARHEIENLALLAEVWGFAKYHHPAITGGAHDWDAALLQVMPTVMDAPDAAAARRLINDWLAGIGEPPRCWRCAVLAGDLHLQPDVSWIGDTLRLGSELSGRLQHIHRNRSTRGSQRYVSLVRWVNNPEFSGENPYADRRAPDPGYRQLALFRYWNVIRYWFPYRDLMEDDWGDVLAEFIPIFMAAETGPAYILAVQRLAGRIQDTHSSVGAAFSIRPPAGNMHAPVIVRFVEGSAVVTGYSNDTLGAATGLVRGDVILRIDDAPVDSLMQAWAPYYPASNEPARRHLMAQDLLRGRSGTVRLTVRRGDEVLEREVSRVPSSQVDRMRGRRHSLPGEAFRMLEDDVAYLSLAGTTRAALPDYMRRAAGARLLIIDIRNYPAEFVVHRLAGHLVDRRTPFYVATTGDMRNPGAFRFSSPRRIAPVSPRFRGKVVVLVDESSISQAEFTAMALRAGPNTTIVGSTTAGADGNVSRVPLPGGIMAVITGIGIFYPDRSPTQRIGIVPDVEVRPTIAGIRAGRDEVLEAALRL